MNLKENKEISMEGFAIRKWKKEIYAIIKIFTYIIIYILLCNYNFQIIR